jgi:hypothetical protein
MGCPYAHYGTGKYKYNFYILYFIYSNKKRVEGRPKDELADVVLEVAALAKKYLEES